MLEFDRAGKAIKNLLIWNLCDHESTVADWACLSRVGVKNEWKQGFAEGLDMNVLVRVTCLINPSDR